MAITFKPKIESSSASSDVSISAEECVYMDFVSIRSRMMYQGYSEMCEYVRNNITKLLSSAVDKKPKALQIITSKEFLIAMGLNNITLNREYTNRFNRVYRAYVINPAKNVIYNQENANLLYNVALKLNKDTVDELEKLGLNENTALWITVNRYSSTDERRNIRRMVRTMQHVDPLIMTEQMAVDIFAKTFNDQLTNLFVSIMTDRFDAFDSEDEKYVYSTISNAILDILNTMPEEDIQDILKEYSDELVKSGVTGRFSLRSVNSGDYRHICNAVDELESRGVYVE